MDEGTRPGGPSEVAAEPSAEQRTPAEIRHDIEDTREQLGETVEALVDKADVKAQTKERVESLKADAKEKISGLRGHANEARPDSVGSAASSVQEKAKSNPLPVVGGVALAVGFVLGRITARG